MKNLDRLISKIIKEATGDSSGSRGSYAPPMQPGLRYWDKSSLGPFLDAVSDFKSPLVQYDSYDHKFDLRLDQIKELEKVAGKIQSYIKHHPYSTFSDEDGNPVNPYMQDGFNPNVREKLAPFTEKVPFNEWVEVSDKGVINEDLAVWFGKKKKPKGSSQPKGPWVNICRKVDGKHPPCGRHDTSKGSYPKCRAAGVAGKMSDSAKKAACAQKRAAEKKDPQTGKGQKPVMTSYNPKKKTNEQMSRIIKLTESDLKRIITRILKESEDPINIADGQTIKLSCKNLQTGQEKPIEGNVEVGSRNVKWGHLDPYTDQYIEPEEVIPEFIVTSQAPLGVVGDEEIADNIYIEKVGQDLKDLVGYTSGYVLTHFDEKSVRYYCKIDDVSDQLRAELLNYGVNM